MFKLNASLLFHQTFGCCMQISSTSFVEISYFEWIVALVSNNKTKLSWSYVKFSGCHRYVKCQKMDWKQKNHRWSNSYRTNQSHQNINLYLHPMHIMSCWNYARFYSENWWHFKTIDGPRSICGQSLHSLELVYLKRMFHLNLSLLLIVMYSIYLPIDSVMLCSKWVR